MALITRTGKVLLNPAEQRDLYKHEVFTGFNFRNDGSVVKDKKGKPAKLTNEQIIWRKGWLARDKYEQKIYMSKHGKKARSY